MDKVGKVRGRELWALLLIVFSISEFESSWFLGWSCPFYYRTTRNDFAVQVVGTWSGDPVLNAKLFNVGSAPNNMLQWVVVYFLGTNGILECFYLLRWFAAKGTEMTVVCWNHDGVVDTCRRVDVAVCDDGMESLCPGGHASVTVLVGDGLF